MSDEERGGGFDPWAANYDEALQRGLSLSGEGRDFFARGRVNFLAECLAQIGVRPRRALDFGCGTGDTVPLLAEVLGLERVLGLDEAPRTVEFATSRFGSDQLRFSLVVNHAPAAEFDLVYLNGVLHHVSWADQPRVVARLAGELRPGGILSLWENNPWNPGTRWVMSRIPFDREAVVLSASRARRLARATGLAVIRTDYRFIFPGGLALLRPVERLVTRLPLGAQYQVLCRKP